MVEGDAGKVISGIAVRIGKDEVYSNDAGDFELRIKKPKSYAVSVALADSVAVGNCVIVSAPETIGTEQSIKIVLKKTSRAISSG